MTEQEKNNDIIENLKCFKLFVCEICSHSWESISSQDNRCPECHNLVDESCEVWDNKDEN